MTSNGEENSSAPPASSAGTDRIRESTDHDVNRRLDAEALEQVRRAAAHGTNGLTQRVRELDAESDIERWLMINASVLALTLIGLGAFVDRLFLIGSAVVLGFLLQHGIQGWCPPLPLFRRRGVRTRREIAAERAAVKALRGDFEGLAGAGPDACDEALEAGARE